MDQKFGSYRATVPCSTTIDPPLIKTLKSLKAKNFTMDGEIAALGQHGRSSLQILQSYGVRKG